MVLPKEPSVVNPKPKSTDRDSTTIKWTCKFSTPKMTIMLYNMAGFPVYHGCLQSPHLFANNTSNMGTVVHVELGGFNLQFADENQEECLKQSLFGVESISSSILQITKVSLDWGKKDMKSGEKDPPRCMLGLSVDVTSIGIYLTFKRIESFISTAISLQTLVKSVSSSKKTSTQSRGGVHSSSKTSSGKGAQMLKFNLVQFSVYVSGETGLENTVVPDPKRVNYGSQGGRVIISVSADGTPRTAKILSTVSDEYQKLKYCISLEISNVKLFVNKEKQSKQIEIERARCIYQEYLDEEEEGENSRKVTKVVLFDMKNTKFVQRLGGLKENAACSLFSATEITMKWEPDVQLSVVELVLQLKLVVHNKKLQECGGSEHVVEDRKKIEATTTTLEKKKKESILAVDVEMLNISAELGDGVDAMVQVKSIFSENACIGVLFEGLVFKFNGARIVKSSRMQLSRIPRISKEPDGITTWDYVIQGLDVNICLPFRLQLRAIDDVLEDMLRALKLIVSAKSSLIFPMKKESSEVKNPSSSKFGCLKFFIRKLTFDIEEEPIQGWLDEHYQLLKKEVGELVVRLDFFDEFISKTKKDQESITDDTNNNTSQGAEKIAYYNDIEVDVNDPSVIDTLREEIYKQSFRSYYEACQKLVLSEGSGACASEDFQSGFKPSTSRSSVFTVSALDLDVTLTKIDGGDDGMIEVVRKLDPVSLECDIPFSRLYGANILLNTASLVAQIRDYTFPLFSGSTGKCKGGLVLAQQATSFQPQMLQDVYVGRWRKVCLLRSATGTTPPMKTYADLPLHFEKGEVSFGVSYEPVFADISYAFTRIVLKKRMREKLCLLSSLRFPQPFLGLCGGSLSLPVEGPLPFVIAGVPPRRLGLLSLFPSSSSFSLPFHGYPSSFPTRKPPYPLSHHTPTLLHSHHRSPKPQVADAVTPYSPKPGSKLCLILGVKTLTGFLLLPPPTSSQALTNKPPTQNKTQPLERRPSAKPPPPTSQLPKPHQAGCVLPPSKMFLLRPPRKPPDIGVILPITGAGVKAMVSLFNRCWFLLSLKLLDKMPQPKTSDWNYTKRVFPFLVDPTFILISTWQLYIAQWLHPINMRNTYSRSGPLLVKVMILNWIEKKTVIPSDCNLIAFQLLCWIIRNGDWFDAWLVVSHLVCFSYEVFVDIIIRVCKLKCLGNVPTQIMYPVCTDDFLSIE